jgi:hypothetical protein
MRIRSRVTATTELDGAGQRAFWVAPATFGDLDSKLTELRKAEEDFLTATAASWLPPTAAGTPERLAELNAARVADSAKYVKYKALAGSAHTMFAALFTERGANPNLEPEPP